MKAGPRLIGVAFIEQDEVRDEEVLRPRLRGAGAEIGGRRRDDQRALQCQRARRYASRGSAFSYAVRQRPPTKNACARSILSTLERRAYRRPVTASDVETLMPFYTAGKTEGGFDLGISERSSGCW